ncbi:MAG: ABC transporter substrate-binding protein [Rhizobiaceae bacterium]|nr:ABC transporter substrate-binding protein [Rhizobiaceae bacterium]
MNEISRSKQDRSLSHAVWAGRSKWGKFGVIVLVLILLSTIASLITRVALFSTNFDATYKIALIAPMTGENETIGQSLRHGAELYIKTLNQHGGIEGRFINLTVHDNKGDAELSSKLAASVATDNATIAVIGPWSAAAVKSTATAIENSGPVMITPSPQAYDLAGEFKSLFTLSYSQTRETQFLANYMRNILQEKLVSVIVDDASNTEMANKFGEAFDRFGIPLRHRWSFNSKSADAATRLATIVKEVKAANDSGALFLAMNENQAAKLIIKLRKANAVNTIMGPHMLGTEAFAKAFGVSDFETYSNGVITAAPLMYDTANQNVQTFRSAYIRDYGSTPDWIAAYGYESANAIGAALAGLVQKQNEFEPSALRGKIGDYLTATGQDGTGINTLSGNTVFDSNGASGKSIQVGIYDGRHLISALTQLQPISTGEVDNYIQAVREGRALYVNDRFMYKTNVVYSGLLIDKILDYDAETKTVEMKFAIWFRYRGDFKPQDIVFSNAVEPIKLDKPDRKDKIGDLNYLRYKLKARFNTDFLKVDRNFGSQLLGTTFRHRLLNKNNLIYVVDVVGVGLTDGGTYKDRLIETKALGPSLGLVPDRAWISQDIVRTSGLGDPNFVGHGKPAPNFSQLSVGIIAVDGTVSLSDVIPSDYLIYLTIFAIFGAVFAMLMDRKREGKKFFWGLQSWLLRLICWPLFLASAGSLTINFAFQNLEFFYIDLIVPIYQSLWWVIGALLVIMAIERFIWLPLENSTERKVPGSIRAFVTVIVLLFAGFGIVAFVLHKELTSLLATSGLLAMIIGLAVQANIANIFSGIVLNLERPFRTGDWIIVAGSRVGQVTDITWRSTKVRTMDRTIISLPNAEVAESEIENFTYPIKKFSIKQLLYFDTHHDPVLITKLIHEGLAKAKCVDGREKLEDVLVKLIEINTKGMEFLVRYDCTDRDVKNSQDHEVLTSIVEVLSKEGIHMKAIFPDMEANETFQL